MYLDQDCIPSILSHLRCFLQMMLHCSFVSFLNPKGLLPLLPLLGMYPDTENVLWKFLVWSLSHPQFAWQQCIHNSILYIIFKMLFCWMPIPIWISLFRVGWSRIKLLVLRNSMFVKVNLHSQSILLGFIEWCHPETEFCFKWKWNSVSVWLGNQILFRVET